MLRTNRTRPALVHWPKFLFTAHSSRVPRRIRPHLFLVSRGDSLQSSQEMGLGRKTSIVVPCYNEAQRLNCGAFESALGSDANLEFVFVNDGSKDATGDVLGQLRQRAGERAHVLELQQNSGKAEAVRQ